jgi:hypothetical protein
MATLYIPHFVQFLDDDGAPLAGGKLYSYEAGTSTPKDTYTDASGGTPNANPVVLDASGRATVFLSGSYKFTLKTSADVEIETTDNVSAFATSVSGGVSDITGDYTDTAVATGDSFVFADASDNDNARRDTVQGIVDLADASMASVLSGLRLNGLTLSNNGSDATNDIDIAVGSAVSDDGTTFMTLGSSITKRLDASWAVGTNQGGLDTGAIANTTYHVWLIKRTDTGVVDVLFSTSASSPTMPTNYTKKKCIGSIIRSAGAILAFSQLGNEFLLSTSVQDLNATNPGTSAVSRTLTVPAGVKVWAIITAGVYPGTTTALNFYISSLDQSDEAPVIGTSGADSVGTVCSDQQMAYSSLRVRTNTSSQIRSRLSTSGASDKVMIRTYGWVDPRF